VSKLKARKNRTAFSASFGRSTSEIDFVSIAIAYAEEAIQNKREYGHWVRCAAKRFIKDLKVAARKKKAKFVFSPGQANRVCTFIEMLPHVEGKWDTPTIVLHPAHVFFLVNLFGFRDPENGTRRFTTALLATARKNAKSTLAAAIMAYCECFEEEQGAQLLSAATTGSQASIVFNIAKRMIEGTDGLREEFDMECFSRSIVRYDTGSVFKPINSKASTQDGLNPSHVSLDEIHAHKTHDLVNVLRQAAGGRISPLWLYTTTEGFENPGPWAEERAFAENILNGVVEADHYLALIWAVDDGDEDFDEIAWRKANPLFDVNPLILKEMRKLAIEAKNKPGSLSEFRIKRLNRRASSATSWTNLTRWRKCSGAFEVEQMVGAECWAAFDGASTTDMAAWRLLWKVNDLYYTWGRFWVPHEAVAHRTERRSVNYAGWVEAGWVTECDGASNDYQLIKQQVLEDIRRFNPKMIAYDPWNATQFINELIAEGVDVATPEDPHGLIQFRQGAKSFNPAMKLCESVYLDGNLLHGGNPVLTWHAANVVPTYDTNMNVKPNKLRSPDKIDGMVALFMAFGCAAQDVPEEDPFAQMVSS